MTSSASRRLFFALWPDAPARQSLCKLAIDVAARRGGRAPREGNLHVTVAFLGNVRAERVAVLETLGENCARACSAFDLPLDALGGTAQGIAWLAPTLLPPPLASLHASLVAALAADGFTIERRTFRPHVTLARNCTSPAQTRRIVPIAWRVDRLALVASTPGRGGSAYEDIAAWTLAKDAPA